jgi:D-amino-acid oxidase
LIEFTGVIGLTTALKLQEQGTYQVTIVSDVLPTDPKSIRYTSRWAVRSNIYVTPSHH